MTQTLCNVHESEERGVSDMTWSRATPRLNLDELGQESLCRINARMDVAT